MPGKDLRKSLFFLACGKVKENPFPKEELEELRWDLILIPKKWGHGEGLPRAGDRVQAFDTRLMQGLLTAMKDPDHYFMEWWSIGGWLGSKDTHCRGPEFSTTERSSGVSKSRGSARRASGARTTGPSTRTSTR